MAIIEITNFEEQVLKAPGTVMVDYLAPWCGYCRRLTPAVEQVAADYEGKLQVVKVDIDDLPAVADEYQVETIPTLMLFREGKNIAEIVNPESRAKIVDWLKENGVE